MVHLMRCSRKPVFDDFNFPMSRSPEESSHHHPRLSHTNNNKDGGGHESLPHINNICILLSFYVSNTFKMFFFLKSFNIN